MNRRDAEVSLSWNHDYKEEYALKNPFGEKTQWKSRSAHFNHSDCAKFSSNTTVKELESGFEQRGSNFEGKYLNKYITLNLIAFLNEEQVHAENHSLGSDLGAQLKLDDDCSSGARFTNF
jgi:hypothetical protein